MELRFTNGVNTMPSQLGQSSQTILDCKGALVFLTSVDVDMHSKTLKLQIQT